jgi:hypothetical protein
MLASVAALLLLGGLDTAFAATTECDLSLQPGLAGACPTGGAVGAASPNPSVQGATVAPKTEGRVAIDAFGYCRYVRNDGSEPLFVPFGSEEEWRAFQTNHPASASLSDCARGGAVIVPPNFGHDGASNQCVTPPPPQAIFAPYKPANAADDYTAPIITYNCSAADGAAFTETAAATLTGHDSGYGPNYDIGWSFSKILYKYDGQCGPAKGIPTPTAPTSGLCRVGVPSAVIGTGPFTWICASGTGGGKNASCSSATTCETHKMEEKPCRCDDNRCYRAIYWSDGCGHTWIDKTQSCDKAEPLFAPQHLPSVDDTND